MTIVKNIISNFEAASNSVLFIDRKPEYFLNRAQFYFQNCQIEECIDTLNQAFENTNFSDGNYETNLNIAKLSFELGVLSLAVKMFEKLAFHHPTNSHAHMNLAFVLKEAHFFERSEQIYRTILKSKPQEFSVSWNFSHLLLLIGKYEEGLKHYESRWNVKGFPSIKREFSEPQWSGEANNIKLLIHAEQGFGDTIQAARYLCFAQKRVGHLVIEIQKDLLQLFKQSCSSLQLDSERITWVEQGKKIPNFDMHIPFMSLPLALNMVNFKDPPFAHSYLNAKSVIERVNNENNVQPLFAGLVWKGRPSHPHDSRRSFTLNDLEPILKIPGIKFFSFQQRLTDQEALILNKYNVINLEPQLTSFLETAELLKSMNLVICADTAVAHLSSALGVPTWIAIAACPDWRWGIDDEFTFWYERTRLWRQGKDREWASVFLKMSDNLLTYVSDWLLEDKWLPKQN